MRIGIPRAQGKRQSRRNSAEQRDRRSRRKAHLGLQRLPYALYSRDGHFRLTRPALYREARSSRDSRRQRPGGDTLLSSSRPLGSSTAHLRIWLIGSSTITRIGCPARAQCDRASGQVHQLGAKAKPKGRVTASSTPRQSYVQNSAFIDLTAPCSGRCRPSPSSWFRGRAASRWR